MHKIAKCYENRDSYKSARESTRWRKIHNHDLCRHAFQDPDQSELAMIGTSITLIIALPKSCCIARRCAL